jgi:hypothetical protein
LVSGYKFLVLELRARGCRCAPLGSARNTIFPKSSISMASNQKLATKNETKFAQTQF